MGLGNLTAATPALAVLGLLVIAALQARAIKGAILVGILGTAGAAWFFGLIHGSSLSYHWADLSSTAFQLNIPAALNLKGGIGVSLVEIVFVFLFVDLFDNVGTLMAVTKRAGLVQEDGTVPRMNRILLADSIAMLFGALAARARSPATSRAHRACRWAGAPD
ncbi:xanthine/uracil permease family protein [mine drainage metagenome]|uniref:Xanthine/uracil permease family protein n=1 Tax=mine drainage metagenome TaxID=410659 RepID=T1CDN4_9ZZZZ